MMVLDFSIVNVALPSIERELQLSPSVADWVVTAYAIAFGGLLILGGRAADMLGRRRMFVIGLVAFSLASLSGGLAQDPVLLLASRVVQGPAPPSSCPPRCPSLPPDSPKDGNVPARSGSTVPPRRSVSWPGRCWAGCSSSSPAGARCSW